MFFIHISFLDKSQCDVNFSIPNLYTMRDEHNDVCVHVTWMRHRPDVSVAKITLSHTQACL